MKQNSMVLQCFNCKKAMLVESNFRNGSNTPVHFFVENGHVKLQCSCGNVLCSARDLSIKSAI